MSTGEHNLGKDGNGKYLLNTVQLAWVAWQAGYDFAKEEQDSNLTCDRCCNELGIDDGSIRLCGECKGKQSKWISVKDKLPEKSGFYIVFVGEVNSDFFHLHKKDFHHYQDFVTHWQPLPEPPTIE